MAETRRIGWGLAVALGLTTTSCGLVLAAMLTWPAVWPLDHLTSPAVSEARAATAAARKPPDLRLAEQETSRTLSQRPADAVAWARLAWIADQRGDRTAMLQALERSYVVAPFGPDITRWRLRFAYERWSRLTPELRGLALSELMLASRTRPRMVEEVEGQVTDPSGRMALRLALAAGL
jgi:hypothetical protein